ncbi:MAG: DUF4159 domain-containing protein [Gemmatimonadota bacterium]
MRPNPSGHAGRLGLIAVAAATLGVWSAPELVAAQDTGGFPFPRGQAPPDRSAGEFPYDGRFTLARIYFESPFGGGPSGPAWSHDYPTAERNFARIVDEISALRPYLDGSRVVALDDPDLFLYPVAYLSEPGFWVPSEDDVAALRAYLLKGGFVIFDDFGGPDWINFRNQMERVLPDLVPLPLDGGEPIFHSFFEIAPSAMSLLSYRGGGRPPQYFGYFEGNDPTNRMIAVANYNNDIGEFWEFSATGRFPVDLSNEAYKLGVNYVMYALTH